MTYQGWKNYETWNVALWINNDQSLYNAMRDKRPFTAVKAEAFCMSVFPNGTPDLGTDDEGEPVSPAVARERMALVDWQEIANDFNAE